MTGELEKFVESIVDFDSLSAADKIPYFIYYLTTDNENYITAKDIKSCFDQLSLAPYSNISAYLGKKVTGKDAILLRGKNGYRLTRPYKIKISTVVQVVVQDVLPMPTANLIDIAVLDNAPYYIKKNAEQMCSCYDSGLYDACLVMMRKLIETLIIECFERYGIAEQIKDVNGCYLYLSDLIPKLLSSSYWVASRNVETNIKEVKRCGDLSAHNRRFLAKKNDIDSFKFQLRQTLQEIILIIDYSTWTKGNKVTSI